MVKWVCWKVQFAEQNRTRNQREGCSPTHSVCSPVERLIQAASRCSGGDLGVSVLSGVRHLGAERRNLLRLSNQLENPGRLPALHPHTTLPKVSAAVLYSPVWLAQEAFSSAHALQRV